LLCETISGKTLKSSEHQESFDTNRATPLHTLPVEPAAQR
jgi:hypothetical protein